MVPVLLLFLAAIVPPAPAQDWISSSRPPTTLESPLPNDPMKVTVHRLSNGLTVYLSPNAQEPRVTAWVVVRAGSKHDAEDSTGMAHYLEHMLFKGSERLGTSGYAAEKEHLDRISAQYDRLFVARDPGERARIYKEIDAENIEASRYAIPNELSKAYKTLGVRGLNAFTSKEHTVFTGNLPKNRLEAWARLEADRFGHAVFRLFQTEIETVYEEKNLYADDPGRVLLETLDAQLFKTHPYARTIAGSIEHLKNPSLAKMRAFYGRFYAPNNMAVVLAGDFDRKEALKVLEKYFGGLAPKALPSPDAGKPDGPRGVERKEIRFQAEEQIVVAWPTVPEGDPDHDAVEVMDMVMDNAKSGLVNLRLNQAQKVKEAGSYPVFMNEAGAWSLWGIPKDGQTLEEVEGLLMETVAALKAGEFSEEDLRAILTNFEVAEKLKLESNDSRVGEMAHAFESYEEWPRAAGHLERLGRVTKEDVLRVARKYLGEDRIVVLRRRGKPEIPLIKKPEFTRLNFDPRRSSDFFNEVVRMPAAPIEPKWLKEGRDYRVSKARFGRVYAAKNPMNDLFALGFHFDRGRKQARNLCAALELLDLSGAGPLSADQFKKALYALGTTLNVSCGERDSDVSLSGLEGNLGKSLELLRLHFQEPNISSGTLARLVQVQIGAHKDNKVNPSSIGGALTDFAHYGPRSGTLTDLSDAEWRALPEPELAALMRTYFDYERRVSYVGAREAGELARLLDEPGKEFKPLPPREPKPYARAASANVLFTHRDMVQSQVGLVVPDGVYDPGSAVDYQFFSAYAGGSMNSVLYQEIREARSLAYDVRGGYDPGDRRKEENKLYGYLGCQADKTVEAASLLDKLLTALPASEERFAQTRQAIEQAYRTNPIQFRAIPGTVMHWEDLGLPGDPRPERYAKVLKYRLDDLTRFASRFSGAPVTIYVLGSRDRVDMKGLAGLGPVTEKSVDELFPY